MIFLGAMTDLFDGILARKLGVACRGGDYFDHTVDTVFVSSVMFPVWKYLNPKLVLASIALSCLVILVSPIAIRKKEKEIEIKWPNIWGKIAFGFLIGSACVALMGIGLSNVWQPYFSWLEVGNGVLGISVVLRIISFWRFYEEVMKDAKSQNC